MGPANTVNTDMFEGALFFSRKLNLSLCSSRDFSCADPESFVRGGPTLKTFLVFFYEGRKDQNTTISGPSSALIQPAKY